MTDTNINLQFNKELMDKALDNSELIFKITTKVKATNKTPEMIYMSATNNLPRWVQVKKELIRLSCDDKELNDGIIFAEHGFWVDKNKLDKLIEKGKIKVEMDA